MTDDSANPNPNKDNTAAPDGNSNQDQKGTPANQGTSDAVAMAKELGETKAKLEAAQARVSQIEPVLETIYSNEDLLKRTTEIHNKRTGVTPPDEKKDDKIAITPQKPSPVELDNRNAHIKTMVDNFFKEKGIDKLEKDKQAEINTKIGAELREMLDPMGNKNLQQIMETVSVTKLPQYLDKAYFLATRNEQMQAARDEGKQAVVNEGMGVIGSMASSSITPDKVTLSTIEKDIARKQGISEEKYLENKKEILKRDGKLF